MRLILAGVGRLKAGPERDLLGRYLTRSQAIGRTLGFAPLDVLEIDEAKDRSAEQRRRGEAALLVAKLPPDAVITALDERGRALSSRDFAAHLKAVRDGGAAALALVVGGPDGFDPAFRASAGLTFGFGAATIPHQIVRVLLAEQVYRAMTIMAGHPYHRD